MELMSDSKWKLKRKRLISRKEKVGKFSGSSPPLLMSIGEMIVANLIGAGRVFFSFHGSSSIPLGVIPSAFPNIPKGQRSALADELGMCPSPLFLSTKGTTLLDSLCYTFYKLTSAVEMNRKISLHPFYMQI